MGNQRMEADSKTQGFYLELPPTTFWQRIKAFFGFKKRYWYSLNHEDNNYPW